MKFSTREDIDAPIDHVFDMLCEFDQYERAAMRRGVEIRRRAEPETAGLGTAWDTRFVMRGKEREMTLEITGLKPPEEIVVGLASRAFEGTVTFELIALSRNRTRLLVGFDIKPLTLPARLLLQSLKITKPKLDRRYKQRVSGYVQDMTERLAGEA
jgi:uncharacterized protein YndB with AHSA1/START domain